MSYSHLKYRVNAVVNNNTKATAVVVLNENMLRNSANAFTNLFEIFFEKQINSNWNISKWET